MAVEADGVHLGQSDMPVSIARKLLPKGSIIGVSCNTIQDAKNAVRDGADYVGIGPVWFTKTKSNLKPVIGPRGAAEILETFSNTQIKAVAIGGIKSTNLLRLLHGAVTTSDRPLDGIAVVGDIMAAHDPFTASLRLSECFKAFNKLPPPQFSLGNSAAELSKNIVSQAAILLKKIRETGPLIHQITNNVVMNQSANATLALGASPIMATAVQEMEDLSKISGALLVNFGTISDKSGMLEAGKFANATRKPVVFDPVAVGATEHRRKTAEELLSAWQASVIKGNPAEIGALAKNTEVQSRGVDSLGTGFADPATLVRNLAKKERCIIAMTGKKDWVSDGKVVISIANGHELLCSVTGSGCMVGTSVATFCAGASALATDASTYDDERVLVRGDMLTAAVGGILAITVASEFAAARQDVKGTGTFLPALIDELYNLTPETLIDRAQIEVFG